MIQRRDRYSRDSPERRAGPHTMRYRAIGRDLASAFVLSRDWQPLAALVARQKYFDRAAHDTFNRLRLHRVQHAQEHSLQQFRFEQTQ